MKKIIYNKLIRDRIPDIIKADNHIPKVYTLDQENYLIELKKKVIEESNELQTAINKKDILNELSDIQELIDAILKANSITKKELIEIQSKKREKRGGFSQRLFLEYVEEK